VKLVLVALRDADYTLQVPSLPVASDEKSKSLGC